MILLLNETASQADLFLVICLLVTHTVALNRTLPKKNTMVLLGQNDSVSKCDMTATPHREAIPALPWANRCVNEYQNPIGNGRE